MSSLDWCGHLPGDDNYVHDCNKNALLKGETSHLYRIVAHMQINKVI